MNRHFNKAQARERHFVAFGRWQVQDMLKEWSKTYPFGFTGQPMMR
jgi:hypothetical protein